VKLLFKPFGMILGLIAGVVSRRLFRALWSMVDERDPPSATAPHASWSRVLGASALRALSSSLTRTTADRLGARAFHWLTGSWPG
jgi:hypothetical protein